MLSGHYAQALRAIIPPGTTPHGVRDEMSIFLLLRTYASSFFHRFGWAGLAIALGVHLSIAWIGLVLLGEQHLITAATFIYFYLTTTLTVGYGDLLPQTSAGRIFVATWIMLGALPC